MKQGALSYPNGISLKIDNFRIQSNQHLYLWDIYLRLNYQNIRRNGNTKCIEESMYYKGDLAF